MSDVYLIEVNGRAVGLVARDETGRGYRFHAATPKVFGLDGTHFATPGDAQQAARETLDPDRYRRGRHLNHAA